MIRPTNPILTFLTCVSILQLFNVFEISWHFIVERSLSFVNIIDIEVLSTVKWLFQKEPVDLSRCPSEHVILLWNMALVAW
jgi:hypothetical protein